MSRTDYSHPVLSSDYLTIIPPHLGEWKALEGTSCFLWSLMWRGEWWASGTYRRKFSTGLEDAAFEPWNEKKKKKEETPTVQIHHNTLQNVSIHCVVFYPVSPPQGWWHERGCQSWVCRRCGWCQNAGWPQAWHSTTSVRRSWLINIQ